MRAVRCAGPCGRCRALNAALRALSAIWATATAPTTADQERPGGVCQASMAASRSGEARSPARRCSRRSSPPRAAWPGPMSLTSGWPTAMARRRAGRASAGIGARRGGARMGGGLPAPGRLFGQHRARAFYERLGFAAAGRNAWLTLRASPRRAERRAMKAYLDPPAQSHDPKHFMANGRSCKTPSSRAGSTVLKAGAEAAGCRLRAPQDHGMGPIAALHSAEYLTFLRTIHSPLARIPDAGGRGDSQHPPRPARGLLPALGRGPGGLSPGRYRLPDLGGHLGVGLLVGAERAERRRCRAGGRARRLRAQPPAGPPRLCRPRRRLLLSQQLRNRGRVAAAHTANAPAILDIDVHHGNGTQGIFYHAPTC
jgi:hypothetical protein